MCAKMTFLNELELKIEARTPIFSFQICNLHPLKYHITKIWLKTNEPFRDDQKTLKGYSLYFTFSIFKYIRPWETLVKIMGPRWLQYFAELCSPEAKWHNCSHRGTISFNPETRTKAVYILYTPFIYSLSNDWLTGGNWQKWKRVFLTCPCHKIYRDEAVGLKSCKNTWKITIFVKMLNLGQYCHNLIFCQ